MVSCATSRVSSLLAAALVLGSCTSTAGPGDERVRPGRNDVSLGDIRTHLEALDAIAAEAGGSRAAGTEGYDASAAYVASVLEEAGYEVNTQSFTFEFFGQEGAATLEVTGGPPSTEGLVFTDGEDFRAMLYSADGDLSAPVAPAGFDPDTRHRDGPGCDAFAFDDFPAGSVALVRPGPCFFRDVVGNAQDAGAAAVIMSFPDYSEGGVLRPTLLSPDGIAVPVFAASNELGLELFAAEGATVDIAFDGVVEQRTTNNVIAESPGGDGDRILMVGGHLDSVLDGPGINDNGSGIAAILAVAQRVAETEPNMRLRFAFWSAEELGLLGSSHYVSELSDPEIDRIEAYLNFDMVGSPNGVTYLYAPDGSELSQRIYDLMARYLGERDLATARLDLEGRSDHGPFLEAGIPVGGIFTGAEMLKSHTQARRFGGTAGTAMDPCYHRPCDDLGNVDERYLDQMTETIFAVVSALGL
jgi:Zn-dependent M28 family amino/carboxypeptidase